MSTVLALRTSSPRVYYPYKAVVALLPADHKVAVQRCEDAYADDTKALFLWTVTQSGHFLDATCSSVLLALIARTYGYYKRAELVTTRHLTEGVWDADTGKSLCAPSATNRNALYRALKLLEAGRYITRYTVKINGADVTSLIYVNAHAILAKEMNKEVDVLRTPKKLRASTDEIDENTQDFYLESPVGRVVRMRTTPVVRMRTTEDNNIKDKNKPSCSEPRNEKRVRRVRTANEIDCKTKVAQIVDSINSRITRTREKKATRRTASGAPSAEALIAMWKSAIVRRYGFVLVAGITGKEYAIFRKIVRAHEVAGDWQGVIEWAVDNWEKINKEHADMLAYKKKVGDWSIEDQKRGYFLGSDRPDLYRFIMSFPKIIKRYASMKLGNHLHVVDSHEVEALRKQVSAAKADAATANARLSRALSSRVEDDKDTRPAKTYEIVNPERDTYFDDVDTELPPWE